jgi:hypothetical protein
MSVGSTTVDRLGLIEMEMREVRQSLVDLVRLSERQTSTLDRLAMLGDQVRDHEARLREVEKYQPGLRETRTWVIGASAAAASAILTFALNFAMLPAKEPMTTTHRPAIEHNDGRPTTGGQ